MPVPAGLNDSHYDSSLLSTHYVMALSMLANTPKAVRMIAVHGDLRSLLVVVCRACYNTCCHHLCHTGDDNALHHTAAAHLLESVSALKGLATSSTVNWMPRIGSAA